MIQLVYRSLVKSFKLDLFGGDEFPVPGKDAGSLQRVREFPDVARP